MEQYHKLFCFYCESEADDIISTDCLHKICSKCLPILLFYNYETLYTKLDNIIFLKCIYNCSSKIFTTRQNILNILENSKSVKDSVKNICDYHILEENMFCKDCNESLCKICFDDHKRIPKFSKHEQSQKIIKFDSKCADHKKLLIYECVDCEIPICDECALLLHTSHKKEFIKQHYENKKEQLITQFMSKFKSLEELKNFFEIEQYKLNISINKQSTILVDQIQTLINLLSQTKIDILEKSKYLEENLSINFKSVITSCDFIYREMENLGNGDYTKIHILSKLEKTLFKTKIDLYLNEELKSEIKLIKERIEKINSNHKIYQIRRNNILMARIVADVIRNGLVRNPLI